MATYHIIINKKVNKNFIEKDIICATGQGQPRPFSFKIQKGAVEIEYEMSVTIQSPKQTAQEKEKTRYQKR